MFPNSVFTFYLISIIEMSVNASSQPPVICSQLNKSSFPTVEPWGISGTGCWEKFTAWSSDMLYDLTSIQGAGLYFVLNAVKKW